MLAAISHDLRTPLTSLRLRCEFLPEGDDRDRMLQTLAQMENMLPPLALPGMNIMAKPAGRWIWSACCTVCVMIMKTMGSR